VVERIAPVEEPPRIVEGGGLAAIEFKEYVALNTSGPAVLPLKHWKTSSADFFRVIVVVIAKKRF
jgi:hypothetical protein